MRYLLDTNTCIRFINGRSPGIRAQMLKVDDTDIAISTIVQAEMYAGSAKSQYPERSRKKHDEFFKRFTLLLFDTVAADHYGAIRADLEKKGTPIGGNDLLIAAVALAHNLTLVTNNTREFQRVVGLKLVDWETIE